MLTVIPKVASKKGIVVTGIILAAITGASFLLWMIPEEPEATFIVTDYENYLDDVKNIHEVLQESMDIEFNNLRNGEISTEDYFAVTEITSSQITTQISEFVTSKPPQNWQESYINYMTSMQRFNDYIIETKVLANLIENNGTEEEINKVLEKIESLKTESIEYAKISDSLRP